MDIQRAILFIRDDERWITKLLIGVAMSLLSIFILPAFILTGYSIQIARNTMDGFDTPLPEWDDFGKYLKDGAIVALALLVYSIPFIILMFIAGIPIAMAEGEGVGMAIGLGLACVAALYGLAMVAISPAVYIQYIREGTFGACIRFSEVIALTRDNFAKIIVAVLAIMAIAIGVGLISVALNIIPCLGQIASFLLSLAMAPYLQMVTGHLWGQLAADLGGGNKGDKFDDMVIMS